MNPSRLIRLCQKELRETLRDRRTIVTLLLMPLLVYPLLSMAINRFILSSVTTQAYKIGVETIDEADLLDVWINSPAAMPPDEIRNASGGELAEFEILVTDDSDPITALKLNAVDVAVKVEPNDLRGTNRPIRDALRADAIGDHPPSITLTAFAGDATSESARRILVERLQWFRLSIAERRAAAGQSPTAALDSSALDSSALRGPDGQELMASATEYRPPVTVRVAEVGEESSGSTLGSIVPLVLVLMTITGAVYPAIDLTAGERERGTMEALMASPVPRTAVLVAKYVAVVSVALLTAVMNLVAMFVTLWASGLLSLLGGGENGLPVAAMFQILGLLVLFSGFFSAVLLSLTSFARSFKEAQAYLIPVMLFSLAPAMLSLLPGVTLSGPLAIAPLINIVLLSKEVLSGTVEPFPAGVAILSTLGYAVAALALAARLFGADAVTRTSGESFASLFTRPQQWSSVPSIQSAAFMTAALVPIYFVVANGLIKFLQTGGDAFSIGSRLGLNAIALIVTFGGVPLFFAWMGRHQFFSSFRLNRTSAWTWLGALVIGLGAWVFSHELFVLAKWVGIEGLSAEKTEQALRVLESWKQVSPVVLLVSLALTPAVIEELCFRGFLFSAIVKVVSPAKTIFLTALLFALFHVVTGNALLLERFFPTFLSGLILGWIAYRTGSVLPGMVMHFTHNGLLQLAGKYHEKLTFLGTGLDDQSHLPATWLAIAATTTIIGAGIVYLAGRPKAIA